jgi:hypothetical protein
MICKRLFITFFLMASILVCPFIYGMEEKTAPVEPKKTAFSFEVEDVISGTDEVGFNDVLPLVSVLWEKCTMREAATLATAALPRNQQAIMDHVKKLTEEQKYNGSTNIVHGVIQYLKDNGYGDASPYEQEINKRIQKPVPVVRMIANIEALGRLGYPVFGATNQDCKQYELYRDHLESKHNISLQNIFGGVITTPVYHIQEQRVGDGLVYWARPGDYTDEVCVMANRDHAKPDPNFFTGVAQVIKGIHSQVEQIIHTDSKQENIRGAQNAGFNSIHFKLPADSVSKTSTEDLDATIDAWEKELADTYGIVLKKK